MHPVIAQFGPFTIYSYGVMVALGFAIAVFLIYKRAGKFNLDKNKALDLLIFILLGGIIGARFLYIVMHMDYYCARPLETINLMRGGLIWYGGFFWGLLIAVLYLRKNRINPWDFLDLIAPYIALAQAVGRIGCLLNGCCYGKEGHPTQAYSALSLILIYIILRAWQEKYLRRWQENRRMKGEIFLAYCILYSIKRFIIEFFRGDNPVAALGLTMSQMVSVLIFVLAVGIFIYRISKWRKSVSGSR